MDIRGMLRLNWTQDEGNEAPNQPTIQPQSSQIDPTIAWHFWYFLSILFWTPNIFSASVRMRLAIRDDPVWSLRWGGRTSLPDFSIGQATLRLISASHGIVPQSALAPFVLVECCCFVWQEVEIPISSFRSIWYQIICSLIIGNFQSILVILMVIVTCRDTMTGLSEFANSARENRLPDTSWISKQRTLQRCPDIQTLKIILKGVLHICVPLVPPKIPSSERDKEKQDPVPPKLGISSGWDWLMLNPVWAP